MFKLAPVDAVPRAQAFDLWTHKFPRLNTAIVNLVWGRSLRKALPHLHGRRVLEVSFGTGYLLSQYAGQFEVSGIDYDSNCVTLARRRLAALNLTANLVEGDAHALPFPDDSFDTLVNTYAFTLYSDPPRAMSEFFRVLAPGGKLVLLEWDYPTDRNLFGRALADIVRWLKMPYVDFGTLLRQHSQLYQDHAVGCLGLLHLYVAIKPQKNSDRCSSRTTAKSI